MACSPSTATNLRIFHRHGSLDTRCHSRTTVLSESSVRSNMSGGSVTAPAIQRVTSHHWDANSSSTPTKSVSPMASRLM